MMENDTSDDTHLEEKLGVYHDLLTDRVIATDLLSLLTDVIADSEAQKIRKLTRQESCKSGTEYLLKILVARTDIPGRWRMLLNALNHHDYKDLALILEEEMEIEDIDRNKRIIDIFSEELKRDLQPLDILPSLVSKGVLGREDSENITQEYNNHGAITASAMLLTRIHRKKSDWYNMFLHALVENKFEHLAEQIDPDFMKKFRIAEEENERRERSELPSCTMENYDSDFGEALTDLKHLNMSPNTPQNPSTTDTSTEKLEESLVKNVLNEHETTTEMKQISTSSGQPKERQVEAPIESRQPTEHDELCDESQSHNCQQESVQSMVIYDREEDDDSKKPLVVDQDREEMDELEDLSYLYEREEPAVLELYRYQEELAQPGIDGLNSIVVAPTNSGKTHVAIRIMQHHLRGGRPVKMVFLVPTSALATQQRDRCFDLLRCRVKVITGESPNSDKYVDLSTHVKNNDIIVATPQILVNYILDKDVSLSDFSLIVFDECHRTYEDTPYNSVMRLYLDSKLTNEATRLPQILGMTASLGSGSAKCQTEADDWVRHLVANLDAEKLVTVKENKEELEAKINNTDTEIILTEDRHNPVFGNLVNNMMAVIEGRIFRADGQLRRPPLERDSVRYTQWCSVLRKEINTTQNDDDLHRSLKIYTDYLEVYHRALIIYSDARTVDALRYLEDETEEMFYEATAVAADHEMHDLFMENRQLMGTNNSQDNPKLHHVQNQLTTQFRNDPDSRAIVYVKTIDLATCLEMWMKESEELKHLNAVRFVGAHAKVGVGGITKIEQDSILKAFRNGDHKVVIGTSVLEEGLDIPRCNLVILYDHVTNEIQRVQTRGRIRRDDSHFVLIASVTGKAAQKEQVNEEREGMATKAVERIQQEMDRDPHGFRQRQRLEQEKDKQLRDTAKAIEREKLANSPIYEVKCNHCRNLICLSSDLRKIKVHHTIVASGLRNTLSSGPRGRPAFEDRDMEHGVAELLCKNCMNPIGSVNKSMCLYFPMPKIDQIVFCRGDIIKAYRKWKKLQGLLAIKQLCPLEDMRFIMGLSTEDKEFYTL